LRTLLALVVLCAAACVSTRPATLDPSRRSPAVFAERLAEADRLASRGCYLCLKEAASAYAELLQESDDRVLLTHALENKLMIALREVELRLPDSGAREAAAALQARLPTGFGAYFASLDMLAVPVTTGGVPIQTVRERREARQKVAVELEKEWPASPMKAYFYLAMALNAGMVAELKPQLDAMVSTHSLDLSLKYRLQAFLPLFSEEACRALVGEETGFGEVHFLLGQRAVLDARLADAHRELTRARELLPDSASITMVLANVKLSYARYAEALSLFDRVPADPEAQLGRAKALSYLKRPLDAIAVLDRLLEDLRNNPGEKYYWRGWNRLQLGESQAAYEDATSALKAMRNNEVYRLAGMASFNLNRLAEARGYFEDALRINATDCHAERYLGQIDAADRNWKSAAGRFSTAAACYEAALIRLRSDLATYEEDITGLSNGLIAGIRAEIEQTVALRANAAHNAGLAAKKAGISAR
jgi:tetratricopeptide (TPR) repeat protein